MYYWIAGISLLTLVGAGIYFASKPGFWIGMGKKLLEMLLPSLVEYVSKRNSATIEADMARCVRMGGEWDNFRKKCRFR